MYLNLFLKNKFLYGIFKNIILYLLIFFTLDNLNILSYF